MRVEGLMDLSDIQGLVLHAYRRLPYAAYVLLRFEKQPDAVRRWVHGLVASESVDSATPKDVGPVVQASGSTWRSPTRASRRSGWIRTHWTGSRRRLSKGWERRG